MAKLSLFKNFSDQSLGKDVSACPAVTQFDELKAADGPDWAKQLVAADPDIALIQVDDFAEEDLLMLTESKLLDRAEVIFISEGEPNSQVDRAMRLGASYHLRAPIDFSYLNELLEELATELKEVSAQSEAVTSSDLDQYGLLLGSSRPMRKLYRTIRKSADSDLSVMLVGESGAGKELVANTLHLMSNRSGKPFVSVNCSAISPELIESELFGHLKGAFTGASAERAGVFEQAEGGTLFLDEITEMPLDQQTKLLRALETGEIKKVGSDQPFTCDVRVVSATNRDPAQAVNEELFREDLYFRLAQFPIRVPTLRERADDIVGLANHFLAYRNAEEGTQKEITEDALAALANHPWPGNVRELKHTIERAYILAENKITEDLIELRGEALAADGAADLGAHGTLEEIERAAIMSKLEQTAGNKTEAAQQLGISVKTLYNKLDKYDQQDKQG